MNNLNSGNTQNSNINVLNTILSKSENGLVFVKKTVVNSNCKTDKSKLIDRIKFEIKTINERDDLTLKSWKREVNGIEVMRYESRFYRHPNILNDTIDFTIKYMGKMIKFDNNNNVFKCKNDKNILVNELKTILNVLSDLDEKHTLFQQIK